MLRWAGSRVQPMPEAHRALATETAFTSPRPGARLAAGLDGRVRVMAAAMQGRRLRIGVDVGGTFTDLALVDEATGRITFHKVPSTPADPSQAIETGILGVLHRAAGAHSSD